jgi:two-component system response regulator NreC
MIAAFRAAVAGDIVLCPPELAAAIVVSEDHAAAALTKRESEVVRLIALGHTNAEIAQLLFLSPRTIKTFRERAVTKLGLSKRSELTAYARSHNMIEAPDLLRPGGSTNN